MPVIKKHQTIIDFATQELGDASAAFDLAAQNGLALTDDVTPGSNMVTGDVVNQQPVDYFKKTGKQVSSNLANAITQNTGIGFWKIGIDFKVS